jgi:hypothetical protein
MRTLGDIIEATRNGERPEYDELRYALLAYQALLTFDQMAFMKLAAAERDGKKPILTTSSVWQWEEHFNRVKRALEKSPKEWVGWNNDPDNPEFQHRRKISLKVMERAMRSAEGKSESRDA